MLRYYTINIVFLHHLRANMLISKTDLNFRHPFVNQERIT